MRHYIIHKLKDLGYQIRETEITEEDVLAADEMFISNATRGIAWVECYGEKHFHFSTTYKIHADLFGV
jgi:branched-chain amino acid aminotransferase